MKKILGCAALVMLIAAPSLAQKVTIDYSRGFDWNGVETFQYVETPESNIKDNQIMADRVASMIRQEMREGGLREVEENPDLYITYHFTSEERKQLSTTSMGMGGYGGYWDDWGGYGGYDAFGGPMMGSSTTREYSYEEGTLVIDAYDSKEKKMVWRGSGTVTVKDKPEKQVKQVENILKKLGKKWDKILAGKGK
jgi:opacity protein-like surface antigen